MRVLYWVHHIRASMTMRIFPLWTQWRWQGFRYRFWQGGMYMYVHYCNASVIILRLLSWASLYSFYKRVTTFASATLIDKSKISFVAWHIWRLPYLMTTEGVDKGVFSSLHFSSNFILFVPSNSNSNPKIFVKIETITVRVTCCSYWFKQNLFN